jgi:hypothetical protein
MGCGTPAPSDIATGMGESACASSCSRSIGVVADDGPAGGSDNLTSRPWPAWKPGGSLRQALGLQLTVVR